MSVVAAANPINWMRALLVAWAAIASLGVAAIGVYHAQTLGKLRTAQADLRESWRVNDSFAATLTTLRGDLSTCEQEFADATETAEAERLRRTAEITALERRLQETRNALDTDLQAAGPALAACLDMPVPGAAYDRLLDAADRAAGTDRGRAPGMDAGAGQPDDAAGCAGAPDHAEGVCG